MTRLISTPPLSKSLHWGRLFLPRKHLECLETVLYRGWWCAVASPGYSPNILETQVSPYSNEPSRAKTKKRRGRQITWNRGHPSPVPINGRGLPQSRNCSEEPRAPSLSPLWFLSEWKVKGTTVNLPHVSLCPVLPPFNEHLIIIDIATCTIYKQCLCSHLDNSGGKTGLLFHHCKIFHYLNPKGAR